MSKSVLFITYDGLLDPLGGSQIVPYLLGIAAHPRPLHVISFEKKGRFLHGSGAMKAELGAAGIGWSPLSFTASLGKLGKAWDLLRMYGLALVLHRKLSFGVIHCRSYQAMQVGRVLKQLTGVKTLFDMRGLWVDERIDGGLWRKDRLLDSLLFRAYKLTERRLLASADHVIALTQRVAPELRRLSPRMTAVISVIPCCADFEHFTLPSPESRLLTRHSLGIPAGAFVLSYLGSLGTWYLLDEMLQFFAEAASQRSDLEFLVITRDWNDQHEARVVSLGMAHLRSRIHVHGAHRDEVSSLVGCSDVMLSFIKPAYSKLASSPTKLAEAFAVGVPVISNTGIGDVDNTTSMLQAGAIVDLSQGESVAGVIGRLDHLRAMGGGALRERARPVLGLEVAEAAYRDVYRELEQAR